MAVATANPTLNFSFAEIKWKIKNVSLALCSSTTNIGSCEFKVTGLVNSSWRLNLVLSHVEDEAKINLKMLDYVLECCSKTMEPLEVQVRCKTNILDSNGEQPLKYEKMFRFSVHEDIVVETFKLSEILSDFPHTDDLYLNFCILIEHRSEISLSTEQVPTGIKKLSNDLGNLSVTGFFSDIEVKVGNYYFYLHKEMFLNVRNMTRLIQEQSSKKINLLNYDEFSMNVLFLYVYSGDLSYVLNQPRIRIAEDIERLDIPDLKNSYPKEIIEIGTVIEKREFNSIWRIENLQDTEDTLNGPELDEEGMNSRFKTRFFPNGKVNDSEQETNYVVFEATLLQSNKAYIDVSIKISCVDDEDLTIYSVRKYKRMNVGDEIDIPLFRRGGSCMNKCLINKDLKLKIALWIATGETVSEVGNVEPPLPFHLDQTLSMNALSQKMRHIFFQPKHDDFVVHGDTFRIRAHKFLLACRCSGLCNPGFCADSYLSIPNIKKKYLLVFLEYLYTGLISDIEENTNYELFNLGFMFEIDHLIERYQSEVDPDNILDVMLYAENENLSCLKSEGFKLIATIGSGITAHSKWNDLLHEKTNLALDILDSIRG